MYRYEIVKDDSPDSPREWDNLGTIYYKHSRYIVGDEELDTVVDLNDCSNWEDIEDALVKETKAVVILPIYMYDHSGITIKTSPFSCSWDSGRVGFIVCSREKALKEYGKLNREILNKIESVLENEVKTFDEYLKGEVYGYKIYKCESEDDNLDDCEVVDSCYGFYGEDYCVQEAKSSIEYFEKKDKEQAEANQLFFDFVPVT